MKKKKKLRISVLVDQLATSSTISNIINCFIETLHEEINSFQYYFEIEYLINNNNIKFCKNCKNCFSKGFCPLDELDDMKAAKLELTDTDLFILACPVYENNVSAFIKAFLDRIGYWCHLMPMLGTKCIIIVTSKSTGHDFVGKYLYSVLSSIGFDVQGILYKNLMKSENDILKEIRLLCKNLIQDISTNKLKKSNPFLEKIYTKYKYIYLNHVKKNQNSYEYVYWQKLKHVDTYQQLIDMKNHELK